MKSHLWKGEWLDDQELRIRVKNLNIEITPPKKPLDRALLVDACDRFSQALKTSLSKSFGIPLDELADFLSRGSLEEKILRELSQGNETALPFAYARIHPKKEIFESWCPLGFLVHVVPSNAPLVPFLSAIEGLLAGNINFLKLSGSDDLLTHRLFEKFFEFDHTGLIKNFVIIARISSSEQTLLQSILSQADGVAAWGSEEATASIRKLTPPHARFIEWGHKISVAYIAHDSLHHEAVYSRLAADIALLDQQACSSPQVIYFETHSRFELQQCAEKLASALSTHVSELGTAAPDQQEQAEITQITLLTEVESALQENSPKSVIEGMGFRVFIEESPHLRASPLFRSVWVKPLSRSQIVQTLHPMRSFLQTVGLECEPQSLFELSSAWIRSGALRIQRPGNMLGSYMGEPHDGLYALQQYSRRISITDPRLPSGISLLDDLSGVTTYQPATTHTPLMDKESVAQQSIPPEKIEVYFKSGGSSGQPKVSIFTYADYEAQMKFASYGLFAAGLEPKTDRCMNLFFGGGLYGGFLSFFTILEHLKAIQLPMAAESDYSSVADWIIRQKVDTLLGMPSYLWGLFLACEDKLAQYKRVKKIFYGGEHFNPAQIETLQNKFGVKLIRSASYGSNDVGPIGYQCQHCTGSTHHLHDHLQQLEILSQHSLDPVSEGEAGRMILSSKIRHGQSIQRYEIGDLGKWISAPCPCGRTSPRFELLGRYGDVFRIGTVFLNYRNFGRALAALSEYDGEYQIHLSDPETITFKYSSRKPIHPDQVLITCLRQLPDLKEAVDADWLKFTTEQVSPDALMHSPASGKLLAVIDRRSRS